MPNFNDVLHNAADYIDERRVLPAGTYMCIVEYYEFARAGYNNTDCVDFYLKPLQAIDVDSEQLTEALNGTTLSNVRIRHRFWADSAWKLKKFLREDLGVPATTAEKAILEAMGRQVIVTLVHKAAQYGTQIFQEVKETARVNS
jgi:hypothetical protein